MRSRERGGRAVTWRPAWARGLARAWEGDSVDLDKVRRVLFMTSLALNGLSALGVALGPPSYFVPEHRQFLGALLTGWAAAQLPFLWLGRRPRPQLSYVLHLTLAVGVLAVAFRCAGGQPPEMLGLHFAFHAGLMVEALILLPFRHFLPFQLLSTAVLIAETQGPSGRQQAQLDFALTILAHNLTFFGLMTVLSLMLDRFHRRIVEYQAELANHNEKLKEEVARRSEMIEQQQQQIFQMQKMEAIGTLAGGVAHDFNNQLTAILGFAKELKLVSEPGDEVRKAADVIERAGTRAATLTEQLLGFARKGKLQSVPVDVHRLVRVVGEIVQRTMAKTIAQSLDLQAKPSLVVGDPAQLQQIVLNLAVNACDAMPDGGKLTLGTRVLELDAGEARARSDLAPGRYLMLSVEDTGTGIAPEVRSRVFEPFFTTKKQGQGTGLGLAMVYGIAKSHGGTVELQTAVGEGTTFRILLPSLEPGEASAPEAPGASSGRGRILVVDDEEVVRVTAKKVLQRLGYSVDLACDGLEALSFFEQHAEGIDLVILDVTMPNMGGRECFRALRKIRPDLKALLTTGHAREDGPDELIGEGLKGIVQKPYNYAQLSAAVQKALAGP
jgi:signal transduction histidine kinase